MSAAFIALVVVTAAVALVFLVGFALTYYRYAGKRLITCPENHQCAAVDVDAAHAAFEAVRTGGPELRLRTCTRWPEKEGCDQACLTQIANAPESTLVRQIVADWYLLKRCAICAKDIPPVVWHEQPPALLRPDGNVQEWTDARPEDLPTLFRTHQPICFTCFLTESFRKDHPQLVIERPREAAQVETLKVTEAVY